MRIATLGPSASNHALVARRYLDAQAPGQGEVVLMPTFTAFLYGWAICWRPWVEGHVGWQNQVNPSSA